MKIVVFRYPTPWVWWKLTEISEVPESEGHIPPKRRYHFHLRGAQYLASLSIIKKTAYLISRHTTVRENFIVSNTVFCLAS
jgi:hypothetical protein